MGIDGCANTLLHDLESFGDEQEGCHGDDQNQAFETGGITQLGRFQAEQAALVIEKSFLNLEAFAVLSKRLNAGRFVTHHLPLLWAVPRTAQSHMHRPESVSGNCDVMKAARLARCELDLADGADPLPVWSGKNQAGFDADAEVPSTDPQPTHQCRITETAIRQESNLMQAEELQQTSDLGQEGKKLLGADLSAGVFEDAGDERYRSSPVQHGDPDQTEAAEQDAGVQRQGQRVRAPLPQGSDDQGALHTAWVDGWILQPSAAPTFGALGDRGLGVDVR